MEPTKPATRHQWDQFSRDKAHERRETAPAHFIDRVKDRYGLDMTLEEYHALLASRKYLGYIKKNESNTIGVIKFKGARIWCLYNRDYKLFTTALPREVGTDSRTLVQSCFSRATRGIAFIIHDLVLEEISNERKEFDSIKDAAIYYFSNAKFPSSMIHKYKHGTVPVWKICSEIQRIMSGEHPYAKLSLGRSVTTETNPEEPSYNTHADLPE